MNSQSLFKSFSTFSEKRSAFYSKNIKSSYSDELIIFYPKNRGPKTDYRDPVVRECNGLIFGIQNNELLAIPPKLLLGTFKYNIVNTFVENNLYDIYEVNDGTRITLYYADRWRISTSRGYDVSRISWSGKSTYSEILNECLEYMNIMPDEFYDRLDKNNCYSFGISHPEYHPFTKTKHIWFIESYSTIDAKRNDINPFPDIIKPQKKVSLNDGENATSLKKLAITALDDYLSEKKRLFGFILRSKDESKTGMYSNLIIESSLMWEIRKMFYNKHYTELANENNFDRIEYTLLSNYLYNKKLFLKLFPQYKLCFSDIEKKINDINNVVVKRYQYRNANFSDETEDKYTNLATDLMSGIDEVIRINIDDSDHVEFIKQYISNSSNLHKIYYYIF